VARNTLFPETKELGNGAGGRSLVLFTSAHGHYSIEKAAQMLGFGSSAVLSVPVDSEGRMIASELDSLVKKAKSEGKTPFYVNATAGTTVLGSYDPFGPISDVCKAHNLWLHIDGTWGGPAIFSSTHKHKLAGSNRADSIAINPHKMMAVPLTCSFLLGADMRKFHKANTPAAYLFHHDNNSVTSDNNEVWDLADLTLQCGRRGDSLKLALGWIYYGASGYGAQIDHAFDTAAYMAERIAKSPNLRLVSTNPPPCLQVCFYYARTASCVRSRRATRRRRRRLRGACWLRAS
jgi:glutamate decarboxylase